MQEIHKDVYIHMADMNILGTARLNIECPKCELSTIFIWLDDTIEARKLTSVMLLRK
uniref:Uncharacterized protein n=1 Tax=Arundo donax TaxID=35708 RepID=A0A0A9HKT3_ARUDO